MGMPSRQIPMNVYDAITSLAKYQQEIVFDFIEKLFDDIDRYWEQYMGEDL